MQFGVFMLLVVLSDEDTYSSHRVIWQKGVTLRLHSTFCPFWVAATLAFWRWLSEIVSVTLRESSYEGENIYPNACVKRKEWTMTEVRKRVRGHQYESLQRHIWPRRGLKRNVLPSTSRQEPLCFSSPTYQCPVARLSGRPDYMDTYIYI